MTWPLMRTLSRVRGSSGVCRRGTSTQSVGTSSTSNLFSSNTSLILLSRSTDVYQNLALEDWIDSNVDLQQRHILLLWRNRPAVVVGRHQNPWAECNLSVMRSAGIPLARRRSGGGTVFHDLGNLNLTFFTSKQAYDRQRNLRVITEALRRTRPELDVHATERLDILLNGHFKISGSASRLSRKSSYHHCTLLYSADRAALTAVLRPSCPGIHSNATPSVPSPVTNLLDHVPTLQWEELLNSLAQQYRTGAPLFACSSSEVRPLLADDCNSPEKSSFFSFSEFNFSAALTVVDPDDESAFPGLSQAAAELRSWEWMFGKTPKFSVRAPLDLMEDGWSAHSSGQLQMTVKNGVIESCELSVPADWLPQRLCGELSGVLIGERFCRHRAAAAITTLLRCENGDLQNRLHNLCDALVAVMG